jgi:hypothetical protein
MSTCLVPAANRDILFVLDAGTKPHTIYIIGIPKVKLHISPATYPTVIIVFATLRG